MNVSVVWQYAIAATVGYVVYRYTTVRKARRALPPGPKPLPIVGNIRDFPAAGEPEFQHWLKHKEDYGPISSVTMLGMTLVLIHDREALRDLLEHAANKTSGRPTMVFANKLCGYESIVLCQGYNDQFRRGRRLLHGEFGTKVGAAQFRTAKEIEVKRQLARALNEPEKWLEHFKTTAAASVLKMTYGYTVETNSSDYLVDLIEKMMTEFSLAAVPGAWLVDLIPALQHLPENFPGATFKKTARQWRRSIEDSAYIPYRFVRRQMESANYHRSYVSKLVQQCTEEESSKLSRADEEAIIWTAASLYGAAADTMVITLTALTLAMVLYPQVQRKAQEEIDRVVGTERLPGFEDRENLPYIDALVKEVLRWWPIAPMGFPHAADEDIHYKDFHIPKGAYLLPAVWWFLHDPDTYANPESFEPERFLSPRNEPDPSLHTFGYGRRKCPGRFVADSSLYLNIAQSLATFNIDKAVDENGKEISVDAKAKPGILNYPSEFRFRVKPRSPNHIDLIRQLEKDLPLETSDAELIGSSVDYTQE